MTLKDVSRKRVAWFLERAIRERGFALAPSVPTKSLLTHLNLLDGSKPTNAAILLFGSKPQSVHRAAKTKCMLVHGTEYQRPFASYQVYGGDLFEQADQGGELRSFEHQAECGPARSVDHRAGTVAGT